MKQKKTKQKLIEMRMPEFWVMKPFSNMSGKEGQAHNSIVAYSKNPWEQKVMANTVVITKYAYQLHIDLWFVKVRFRWTKGNKKYYER